MWLLNNKMYPNLIQYVYKNSKTNTPQKILRNEALSHILSHPPINIRKKKNRCYDPHFIDKTTKV